MLGIFPTWLACLSVLRQSTHGRRNVLKRGERPTLVGFPTYPCESFVKCIVNPWVVGDISILSSLCLLNSNNTSSCNIAATISGPHIAISQATRLPLSLSSPHLSPIGKKISSLPPLPLSTPTQQAKPQVFGHCFLPLHPPPPPQPGRTKWEWLATAAPFSLPPPPHSKPKGKGCQTAASALLVLCPFSSSLP